MVIALGSVSEARSQAAPAQAAPAAAAGQQPVTFTGAASCIDATGKYTVTWTLTLALGDQETAVAEALFNETDAVDGLDLIGQPQTGTYPFSGEAGNLFTSTGPRLVNGPNVATTAIDTATFNPETLTASGMIVSAVRSVNVSATVNRPAACPA
jgi:hypothetical protein